LLKQQKSIIMVKHILTLITIVFATLNIGAQNVGINTATPTTPLEIANPTNLPTSLLIHSGNTQYANGIVVNPSTHSSSRRSAVWLDNWGIMQDANGNGTKDFGIYQGSPGAWRLFITTAGNVGIGTILPGATLNVIHPTANTTPAKPTGTWAAIIENNLDGDDGRHGLSVATRWGGATSKIFEAASYWSGSAESYTPALTVLGNRNVGISTDNPKSKLHTNGGISLGIPAVATGINEVWGSKSSLQLITTNDEACPNHTGALVYASMPCAWGAATLNVAISDNWGSYNTTSLAMRIGQNLTTFNSQIRVGNLAGQSADKPVFASSDGTLFPGLAPSWQQGAEYCRQGSGSNSTVDLSASFGWDVYNWNAICFLSETGGQSGGTAEQARIFLDTDGRWKFYFKSANSSFRVCVRCFRLR
jgi:hypothetical protein